MTTPEIEPMLPTALAFARHGHAVFPLWWPVTHNGQTVCACGRLCGNAAKHPIARYAPNGHRSATIDSGIVKRLRADTKLIRRRVWPCAFARQEPRYHQRRALWWRQKLRC